MERFVSELRSQMEEVLKEIELDGDGLGLYERSVKQMQSIIDRLTTYIQTHPFAGKVEEIRYQKELAPGFYSRLFYFMKVYQVELYRSYSNRENLREMLGQELDEIDLFFKHHENICRYYSQRNNYWDDYLFTRRGQEAWPIEEVGLFIGPEFTLGSYWISWILANQQYKGWVEEKLKELDRGADVSEIALKAPLLEWKGSNADLLEVYYGMWMLGSFGNVTFTLVVRVCEQVYGIELKFHDTVLQNLANRKKSPTVYINRILKKWLAHIDQANN